MWDFKTTDFYLVKTNGHFPMVNKTKHTQYVLLGTKGPVSDGKPNQKYAVSGGYISLYYKVKIYFFF